MFSLGEVRGSSSACNAKQVFGDGQILTCGHTGEEFLENPSLTGPLARHCIVGFVVRDRATWAQNLVSRPELCADTLLPAHPRDNQGFKDVLVRGQDHMLQKKV